MGSIARSSYERACCVPLWIRPIVDLSILEFVGLAYIMRVHDLRARRSSGKRSGWRDSELWWRATNRASDVGQGPDYRLDVVLCAEPTAQAARPTPGLLRVPTHPSLAGL